MLRRLRGDLLIIGTFLFFTGLFFFRLWIPQPGIFMIPEFGLSDILHTHLPGRQHVSMMLKENHWPLWTSSIGTGFPILAEGLVGVFFLPNLLLFRFLPATDAYNLTLAVSFLLAAWGTYWFCRQHAMTRFSAMICGLTFAFGGYFSVQLNHPNYIQAASLMPLLLVATARLRRYPSVSSLLLVSLVLWQQILTGGFQFVWISCLIAGIYLIMWPQHLLIPILRRLTLFLGGMVLALGLAAIQLLPTVELLGTADRSRGLPFDTVTAFPYPPNHLFAFVSPYHFGSPANGSYPPFSGSWGLFWENTAYIGIIPLVFALCSILWIRQADVQRWWGILLLSVLLVLGKYSPFYFLYAFPVFSSFRVPSRFLIVVMFCLVSLYGLTIDRFLRERSRRASTRKVSMVLLVILIAIGFLDEFRFSYRYPPVTPIQWWTQPESEAAKVLDAVRHQPGRIFTIGSEIPWNSLYLKSGWNSIEDYRQHMAFLRPNANMLFSVPSAGIYAGPGIAPKRLQLVQEMLMHPDAPTEATAPGSSSAFPMSRLSETLLRENNVSFVLSSFPLTLASTTDQQKFSLPTSTGNLPIHVTQIAPLPRARLAFTTETIRTVEDAIRFYTQETTIRAATVLIEEEQYKREESPDPAATAVITHDTPLHVSIQTASTKPAILILADTYYPGWQATDNGTPTAIFPVNISQRGVALKEGSHTVAFTYQPQSFAIGKQVTIGTGVLVLLLLFLSRIWDSKRKI